MGYFFQQHSTLPPTSQPFFCRRRNSAKARRLFSPGVLSGSGGFECRSLLEHVIFSDGTLTLLPALQPSLTTCLATLHFSSHFVAAHHFQHIISTSYKLLLNIFPSQDYNNPLLCSWCRSESGWCSDVTSTHGAWRHAGVRFLLSGVSKMRLITLSSCCFFILKHLPSLCQAISP